MARSRSEAQRRYWHHVKDTAKYSHISLKEARAKYSTFIRVRSEYKKKALSAKKAGQLGTYLEFKALFNEAVTGQRKREGYSPVPDTDYFTGESPD